MLKVLTYLRLALAALFFLGSHNLAHSQISDKELQQYAVETALRLEQFYDLQEAENSEAAENSGALAQAHRKIRIFEGFDSSGDLSFLDDIIAYEAYALETKDRSAYALAALFKQVTDVYNPFIESKSSNIEAAAEVLEANIDSDNWRIAHFANSLMAVLKGYEKDFIAAANFASAGLSVVPENQAIEALAARYYSFSIASYLHFSTRSTLLALDSTDGVINAALKINYPLRIGSVLSNLIYASREIDDPATIKQLVNILIRSGETRPPKTPALIEMRAASALIRIGDYENALSLTQKGQAHAENKAISSYLKIWEIQSLAATGQTKNAKAEFSKFNTGLANGQFNSVNENELFKAKALIAMSTCDARTTFRHMDRHAELSIQSILNSNNTNTATLLANLESNKMRQAEREAAREDLFRLEQLALQEKITAGQRGIVLLLLLVLGAAALAGFMTYRSRIATKLKLSAEAALAGEKAKSQFLAVISHELRTPLNGIIGIAELLSRTAPSEQLRKNIGIINKSGLDLLKLVEEILDMSRIEANELKICNEPSNIREIIDGIEMLWRPKIEEKDITFTVFVSEDIPQNLNLDPLRLRQCINNLVSNSAKFTKSGRIHMHIISAPHEDESGSRSQLSIIVADTGRGMRADVIDNLFKPFVQADNSITRQYGGSGLGLSITRSLARMMGGDVTVVSRQGAGSEFTLTIVCEVVPDNPAIDDNLELDDMEAILAEFEPFPEASPAHQAAAPTAGLANGVLSSNDELANSAGFDDSLDGGLADEEIAELFEDLASEPSAPDEALPQPAATASPVAQADAVSHNLESIETLTPKNDISEDDLNGINVLVVEDVLSNQDVMKIFLEPQGCNITCASNGFEALNAFQTRDFDVVLMDIRMPEMDGIEATRQIRAKAGRCSKVPIIALTADATAETNAQCMAAGANIFLSKPVIASELLDSIRFVLKQAREVKEPQSGAPIASKMTARLSA